MHQPRKLERFKAMKNLHSLDTYLDTSKQLERENYRFTNKIFER